MLKTAMVCEVHLPRPMFPERLQVLLDIATLDCPPPSASFEHDVAPPNVGRLLWISLDGGMGAVEAALDPRTPFALIGKFFRGQGMEFEREAFGIVGGEPEADERIRAFHRRLHGRRYLL